MSKWQRIVASIVLALCLPAQVWAVVARPFCDMNGAPAKEHHQMMDHSAMAHGQHSMPDAPVPTNDHDCNACEVCHLACSLMLPSVPLQMGELPRPVFDELGVIHHVDFLREPLLRPPLA